MTDEPTEPLTFEQYWGLGGRADDRYTELVAQSAWNARQPEIDQLRRERDSSGSSYPAYRIVTLQRQLEAAKKGLREIAEDRTYKATTTAIDILAQLDSPAPASVERQHDPKFAHGPLAGDCVCPPAPVDPPVGNGCGKCEQSHNAPVHHFATGHMFVIPPVTESPEVAELRAKVVAAEADLFTEKQRNVNERSRIANALDIRIGETEVEAAIRLRAKVAELEQEHLTLWKQIERLRTASAKLPQVLPGAPYIADEAIAQMEWMAQRLTDAEVKVGKLERENATLAKAWDEEMFVFDRVLRMRIDDLAREKYAAQDTLDKQVNRRAKWGCERVRLCGKLAPAEMPLNGKMVPMPPMWMIETLANVKAEINRGWQVLESDLQPIETPVPQPADVSRPEPDLARVIPPPPSGPPRYMVCPECGGDIFRVPAPTNAFTCIRCLTQVQRALMGEAQPDK